MTKEDFEKEANKWADDMVWALVDTKRKANDDERDFLVQEYKDLQKRFTKELEAQIKRMKKYLDCDFCEYQNNKEECHQCNYLEKTKWTLKGDKEK